MGDVDRSIDRRRAAQSVAVDVGEDVAGSVRTHVVHAEAPDVLLRAAEAAEATGGGQPGEGGFARALLGSVSRHVSQHASCPVVIVRAEPS